ncbi:hypothetical protein G7Y89_g1220 [Cudoniella acicularis]|uniref:Uncharacterized protein n=1 Tax=Cudoniella acicularis TaxID=354080 RepID=A0A8H4RWS0_9HELO|nr:hypothetical protein G7Y89_g1220 [Cudoniella acicularis]
MLAAGSSTAAHSFTMKIINPSAPDRKLRTREEYLDLELLRFAPALGYDRRDTLRALLPTLAVDRKEKSLDLTESWEYALRETSYLDVTGYRAWVSQMSFHGFTALPVEL